MRNPTLNSAMQNTTATNDPNKNCTYLRSPRIKNSLSILLSFYWLPCLPDTLVDKIAKHVWVLSIKIFGFSIAQSSPRFRNMLCIFKHRDLPFFSLRQVNILLFPILIVKLKNPPIRIRTGVNREL